MPDLDKCCLGKFCVVGSDDASGKPPNLYYWGRIKKFPKPVGVHVFVVVAICGYGRELWPLSCVKVVFGSKEEAREYLLRWREQRQIRSK
ncbi:MAG: hypothetical protein PHT51_02140 [Patescibacteria group bacterium]|nr:hypothetical protein [Patescibacteria group bacterium]MDD4611317.1 hypothetical protein [Patescibacteria group bacterium]